MNSEIINERECMYTSYIKGIKTYLKSKLCVDIVKEIIKVNDPTEMSALFEHIEKRVEKLCAPSCVKSQIKSALVNLATNFLILIQTENCLPNELLNVLSSLQLINDDACNKFDLNLFPLPDTPNLTGNPLKGKPLFFDISNVPPVNSYVYVFSCKPYDIVLCDQVFVLANKNEIVSSVFVIYIAKSIIRLLYSTKCHCEKKCNEDLECNMSWCDVCEFVFGDICFISDEVYNILCSCNPV